MFTTNSSPRYPLTKTEKAGEKLDLARLQNALEQARYRLSAGIVNWGGAR